MIFDKYDIAFLEALGLSYDSGEGCIYTTEGNCKLTYTSELYDILRDGWISPNQNSPIVMKDSGMIIVKKDDIEYRLLRKESNLILCASSLHSSECCNITLAPGPTPNSFIIVKVTKNGQFLLEDENNRISCPQDTIFNFIDLTSRKEQIPETDDEPLNKLRIAFEQEMQPEFREFFKSAVSVYSEFFEDVQRKKILYYISNNTAALAGKVSERRLNALRNNDKLYIEINLYKEDNKYKTTICITMESRVTVFSQELPNRISPDSVNAIIHWILTDHDVMKSFHLTSTDIWVDFSLDMALSPDYGMPCHYIQMSLDCLGVPENERTAIIEEYKNSILREFPKEIGGTEYGANMRREVAAQERENLLANSAVLSSFFQELESYPPLLGAIIRSMPDDLLLRCIEEIKSHSVDQAVDQGKAPIVRPIGPTNQG